MPKGTLEVLLLDAQGLQTTDFLLNLVDEFNVRTVQMDPYCIIKYRTQHKKSRVSYVQGRNPQWKEKFVFKISEGVSSVVIIIMDKDTFTADDFIGEANIPLDGVFEAGSLPPMVHRVVLGDYTYCGQIKVGLTFSPKIEEKFGNGEEEEDLGGWKAEYLNNPKILMETSFKIGYEH